MLASLTTSLMVLALAAEAPQSPQWESDYGAALKQTRSDDRPLLIVIDNPATAEQQLDPNVLGQADSQLLGAYDLCRVDASTAYGKKVADVFNATSLPYMAVIDKTGKVILHSQTGALTGEQLQSMLTKYQLGEQPVRVTVAKPVTTEASFVPASTVIPTSTVQPVYSSPAPAYYAPRADCPNCRRGY